LGRNRRVELALGFQIQSGTQELDARPIEVEIIGSQRFGCFLPFIDEVQGDGCSPKSEFGDVKLKMVFPVVPILQCPVVLGSIDRSIEFAEGAQQVGILGFKSKQKACFVIIEFGIGKH